MNDLPQEAVISEAATSSPPAPSAVSDSAQEHEVASTRQAIEEAMAAEEAARAEQKAEAEKTKPKDKEAKVEKPAEKKAKEPVEEKPAQPEKEAKAEAKAEPEENSEADEADDTEGAGAEPSGAQSKNPSGGDEDDAPPPRFRLSDPAKWASADPEVRTEVKRAITELEGGIQKYREGAEKFQQVQEFDHLAQQSGTTLRDAMTRYVQTEMALMDKDPNKRFAALNEIVQKTMGTSLHQLATQIAKIPQDQVAAAKDREIAGLRQQVESLTSNVSQIVNSQKQQQLSQVNNTIAEFAKSHPDVYEHEATMVQLIKAGIASRDLNDAYQKAKALSGQPVSTPAQALKPQGGDTAKTSNVTATNGRSRASKSISGANNGLGKPSERIYSTREALELAFQQSG